MKRATSPKRITTEHVHRLASQYLCAAGLLPHELIVKVIHDPRKADPKYRDRLAWIEVQAGYDSSTMAVHCYLFPPEELPNIVGHEVGHIFAWSTFRWLEAQVPENCREHVSELEEQLATRIGRVLAALPVEWK